MNNIIEELEILREDHPELIITDDIIKGFIEEHIKELIEEIKEAL